MLKTDNSLYKGYTHCIKQMVCNHKLVKKQNAAGAPKSLYGSLYPLLSLLFLCVIFIPDYIA